MAQTPLVVKHRASPPGPDAWARAGLPGLVDVCVSPTEDPTGSGCCFWNLPWVDPAGPVLGTVPLLIHGVRPASPVLRHSPRASLSPAVLPSQAGR